ncbi:MAG: ATP-binding protein [Myxococcota bacterium]|jgi:hypothetical protein|nr:ATP-binding protein [Myxococcota bacterium]
MSFVDAVQHYAFAVLARELRLAVGVGRLRFLPGDGIELWPEEVTAALAILGPDKLNEQAECPIDKKCDNAEPIDEQALAAELWTRHERLLDGGELVAQRWFELCHRLALTKTERNALALLVGIGSDEVLARLARYAWADARLHSPPVGFMRRLLAMASNGGTALPFVDDPFLTGGMLLRSALVSLDDRGTLPALHLVHLHREVLAYLVGSPLQDERLLGFEVDEPPTRLRASLAAPLRRLSNRCPIHAAVIGPEASGRLGIAAQIARIAGGESGLYQVPLDTDARLGRLSETLEQAVRVALLCGAMLVFTGIEALDDERLAIDLVRHRLGRLPVSVVWVSTRELPRALGVPACNVVRIAYPSRAERLSAWSASLSSHEQRVSEELLRRLSGGFLLSEGQIRSAVSEALARRDGPRECREGELMEAARAHAQTGLGALASPDDCPFGLERLVLDDTTHALLQELVDYTQHRDALARQWGFEAALEKGLGVTALFVGPPGTGKSLAATALARELGRELYRVDLSQLVSKYIGETEKHLGSVFDAAEKGEVMLLFDEADSLFGKRTEVKTSVDRYANLEVNFLLQRIERFNGVVVLTTNHEKGIDDAFARRIRFRIHFDAPDAEARVRLWQALLPSQVPLAAEVDLAELAATYELTGGHIKEVILRAAARAYAAGQELSHQELVRSAEAEYRKLGLLSPYVGRTMELKGNK